MEDKSIAGSAEKKRTPIFPFPKSIRTNPASCFRLRTASAPLPLHSLRKAGLPISGAQGPTARKKHDDCGGAGLFRGPPKKQRWFTLVSPEKGKPPKKHQKRTSSISGDPSKRSGASQKGPPTKTVVLLLACVFFRGLLSLGFPKTRILVSAIPVAKINRGVSFLGGPLQDGGSSLGFPLKGPKKRHPSLKNVIRIPFCYP